MHLGGPAQLRERRGQPPAPSAQLWWLLLDMGDWQPPAACGAVRCGPRTLETSRHNEVGRPQKFEPVGPHAWEQPTHVSTSARESARGQGKALRTVNHVHSYCTTVITCRSRAVQWHRWAWLNREGCHRGTHVVAVVGVRSAAKTALRSAQVAESHGPDGQVCVDQSRALKCHGGNGWAACL